MGSQIERLCMLLGCTILGDSGFVRMVSFCSLDSVSIQIQLRMSVRLLLLVFEKVEFESLQKLRS